MATQAIDVLVQRVARQIRQRRAEHHALRGTFWGTLVAALLLVFKASLGAVAFGGGAAFVAAGALAGAVYGALRRIGPVDAARLADRAFALDDRVATALEWAERPDRTPLVDVLVTDTVARVQALPPRRIVRRVLPREVRWLPVPALAVLALALSPAIPLPSSQFPDFLPSGEQEAREERVQSSMLEERSRPLAKDPLKRAGLEERDFAQQPAGAAGAAAGDLSAIFKDMALSGGQTDRALEAMQRALDKMRAQDEAERSGKNLRGGRDDRGARGRERGRGGDGMGPEDQDFGEGEGLLPGRGKSGAPKGEATARLRANPFDVGVEGESRRGRKDGYDTNLTGRGGQMTSRLQYLGVIGQYRKLMEDSITREQVPRDYHDQIRNYFQSLDER